jgi:hypothetical protein
MRSIRASLGKAAWLALLVGATACVPTFDDNLPLIVQPTVLAIQAEPAEAAPGESVQLTAVVATPAPEGDLPMLDWGLCIARKPLTELGPVNPVCVQAPELAPEAIIALGTGDSVTATVPMDACRLFGPSLPEPMNGEPAGRPVDPDPTGGFYQPVAVTLPDTRVTSLGAVRVFCPPSGLDQAQFSAFNKNYRQNENPVLDQVGLLADSGEVQALPAAPDTVTVAPGAALHFQASWAECPSAAQCGDGVCGAGEDKNGCPDDCTTFKGCTGAESYAWFNPDSRSLETRHESIRVSWFATAGRFEHAVTGRDENEFASATTEDAWKAPSEPGLMRIWLVIRDARGGQSARSYLIQVAP